MSLPALSTNRLPTRPRVVIADDGPLVRALFRRILERSTEAVVVAEAADGQEAIEAVDAHQPDLLLLDIAMPNTDGLTAIPEIRRRSP
ncbi:MAG: response regulator, partial [Acidimicrobiales bacterium]|nr:response regulator [Acidimicrobiales bacterium]